MREAGEITSAAGASGLTGGGSAADILRESARNLAFDVSTIKTQSNLEAQARETSAKGFRKAGKIGFLSGVIGAVGSFLGG